MRTHRGATLATLVLGSLITTAVAGAQTCLDDLAGVSGCTANDVKITTLALRPGGLIDGCTFAGDTATLDLTMQVSATANRRYDVGFFIALDAGSAHTGSCEHEALIPPDTLNSAGNPTSGTGPYANFDGDACGEIEQGVLTYKDVVRITVPCSDTDGDGILDVGTCTSWRSSGSGACASVADAIPDTGSKCNCERKNIAGVTVSNATTTTTTTTTTTSTTTTSTTATSTSTTTTTTTTSTSTTTTTTSTTSTTTAPSTTTTTTTSTTTTTAPNQPPTIATAAAASPDPVTGTTTMLSALAADDGGEANLTYTWAVTAGPAPVTVSPNGTNAAKSASATFTRAGAYTFLVTVADQGGLTATSSVTVTVTQTAASATVAPPTASVHQNATQGFVATLRDQFDDPMASQPTFSWMVGGGGTIDGAGMFTAGATSGGPFTVTATDAGSGLSGTADVTVLSDPPTIAVAASATPDVVTGSTTSLSALGADDGGEANLTYTWAMTAGPTAATVTPSGTNAAKDASATFSRAGTYTFAVTVTDQDGLTATSSVTVVVQQTLTAIEVSPPITVGLHGTTTFTASALDQFGLPLATQPTFTWSVSGGGAIDGTGTFAAAGTAGGPHTVTATSGGVQGTSSVRVADMPPTVLLAPTASTEPADGSTVVLSVLGNDDGGESNLTYTWSASGPGPVAYSRNGSHDARETVATLSEPGDYTFTVTITDGAGQSVTVTVVKTVQGTLAVTDVQLYVRRARFTVNWRRHARGKPDDRLNVAGAINPAGLPATLGGTAVDLAVEGALVATAMLPANGRYRSPAGVAPRVTVTLSPRNGKYRVRLARSDLRTAIGLPNASVTGTRVVPVALTVSRARYPVTENRLEFTYRAVADRRARGVWRGPRQRLLDGAFQLLTTKASLSRRTGAYVIRARGVLYPPGSGPVVPTGGLTLQVAEAPQVTIPLSALQRLGSLAEHSTWKYRSADKRATLSALAIRNGKRRLTLRIGRITADEMGMSQAAAIGSRGDLPVRLDVPTAAGTIHFQTTPELVRVRPAAGWRRPAPLVQ